MFLYRTPSVVTFIQKAEWWCQGWGAVGNESTKGCCFIGMFTVREPVGLKVVTPCSSVNYSVPLSSELHTVKMVNFMLFCILVQ